ncbi:hypothetical protein [Phosphitispora fastidiosa]|uniref:hypothetical protein n=1 Tax=Phosphitispora fastidiosa TaxID=2837202 RepID=UPI001E62996F|nr:hypothetical protein [Phosphitispora fastidiosa]MBU7006860.1 hypothetical protein [Phosphitispora fastidiosa]
MNNTNCGSHPPRAKLAIRVGVTGHRPGGLARADLKILKEKIRHVLQEIKVKAEEISRETNSLYHGLQPVLRIISPLAEGSDRIVAHEAIDLGYQLQCPLPYERNEYKKDFSTGDSCVEFDSLLEQATSVFEMDGSRLAEDSPYLSVGRLVLEQSDILVTVWDGFQPRGSGGTGQIVMEAVEHMIPVIWINSRQPHDITILGMAADDIKGWVEYLRKQMTYLFLLPVSEGDIKADKLTINLSDYYLSEYHRETRHSYRGVAYKLFRKLFGTNFSACEQEKETKQQTRAITLPDNINKSIDSVLNCHFKWADDLANYYAALYRNSFIANYLLGGLAVFFALFSYALGWVDTYSRYYHYQWVPTVIELVIILYIIVITVYGNKSRWHGKWIDYRLLAELLRHMKFLAPLGRVNNSFRIPAHQMHNDIRNSWVNWQFRALVRELGLLSVKCDGNYLESYREYLAKNEIENQIGFHVLNAGHYRRITHRLHLLGLFLFGGTLVACFLHIFYHGYYNAWLTLLSAVLPALGAGFAGILFQGEFHRLEQRSAAMAKRLQELKSSLDEMKDFSYADLSRIAKVTAEVMITEVLDWRIMFQARPLQLPS